jgi:hypothetical protein
MKLLSAGDSQLIKQLHWHRDQMLWPHQIRKRYGRSICPSLDTLIHIEEQNLQKIKDRRRGVKDEPPMREIIPVIKTKMSQSERKKNNEKKVN